MVSFCGKGYDVFNFLAIPAAEYDLPMFGADIVVLPGGVLAALDFQPLSSSAAHINGAAYQSNLHVFQKWQAEFISFPGGAMPPAAQRYFSPHALWTRFGLESNSTVGMEKLQVALSEYCRAYCNALTEANPSSAPDLGREKFLAEYLQYRVENDPAKNLLVGAFGAEWTEAALNQVLFPRR